MGNCSASATFDVVADALLEEAINGERLTKILVPLIRLLDGDDWDCQGESIDRYVENPWIMEAFLRTGHVKDIDEPDDDEPAAPPAPESSPAGDARPAATGRGRTGRRASQV